MSTYTKEQIRQAIVDLFAADNARRSKPRKNPTSQQYIALGMVMIALQDYDKHQANITPTPQ